MPVAVARKIEFHIRDQGLNDINITLRPLFLIEEQIAEYNLPRTPIKETERRRAKFERTYPNDLKIDVFRSSGPGGQSVNTTDSAVRITHRPSGLVVSCQDEKSQLKNKAKAMKVLRSRLLDQMIAESQAERARDRKTQVGTGDRSAKIRTYNFPQSRVTDHRIGLTSHRLSEVLDGDLDELISALRLAEQEERMGAGDP